MALKQLDRLTQLEWSSNLQLLALEALAQDKAMRPEEMIFQGGTCLNLAWNSPRRSEDIDFLVLDQRSSEMNAVMRTAFEFVKERLHKHDDRFVVELDDKTKDASRMPTFKLKLSMPDVYQGKAMVKLEFWATPQLSMDRYENQPRQISSGFAMQARVSSLLSAATPETIMADKIIALGMRPYLKMRDVFDVWWLDRQYGLHAPHAEIARRVEEALAIYDYEPHSLVSGLDKGVAELRALSFDKFTEDLDNWLPDVVFKEFVAKGASETLDRAIDYVCEVRRALLARLLDAKPIKGGTWPKEPSL